MNLDKLLADGWREGVPCITKVYAKRSLYKEFPSRFVCSHNDETGIVVSVDYYETPTYKGLPDYRSIAVSVCGDIEDFNHSINIEMFNLLSVDEVQHAIPRLIAAWEAASDPSLISGQEN